MASFSTETETNSDGDFPTGRDSVEAAQGFEKMKLAIPDPPADHEDISSEEIAKVLLREREETPEAPAAQEPIPRQYNRDNGTGDRMPENQTVPIDRAARDLAAARETEDALKIQAVEQELLRLVDGEATEQAPPQPEAQSPEQAFDPEQRPQIEQPPQPAEPNIFEDPRVLTAVQQYNEQVNTAWTQQQQRHAQDLANNAAAAAAGVFAAFPELSGIPANQIGGAIALMQKQNPERALALKNHVANVQQLASEAKRAENAQFLASYQQSQAAFARDAQAADNQFDRWFAQTEPSEARRQEIRSGAVDTLRGFGLSDADIAQAWNAGALRSFAAQSLLADATRWRLAQAGVKQKFSRPAPATVQQPGSPVLRATDESHFIRGLNSKLNESHDVKDAAQLLIARRNARR